MEEERVKSVDIEKWPYAILVVNQDDIEEIVHIVLYPSLPTDKDILSLQEELITDFGMENIADKLEYQVHSSEYVMQLINAKEV